MKTFVYILAFVLLAGFLWLRLSPNDVDRWHSDPADDERAQVRLIGLDAPRFTGDPETVLETLIAIAKSDKRTRILDGSVEEGMITFVATSVIGFRDYITVKAVAEPRNQTKLAVAARSRINGYDWGVNAKRVDRWLQELKNALPG